MEINKPEIAFYTIVINILFVVPAGGGLVLHYRLCVVVIIKLFKNNGNYCGNINYMDQSQPENVPRV